MVLTKRFWILCLAVALSACTTLAPVNAPLSSIDLTKGYRLLNIRSQRVNDSMVMLSFSGGGMRASALSYGVLEELRRTKVRYKGQDHTLLEGVNMISGVSGGSFTALAYALHGDKLFDIYEKQFLKRNVQGELIARTFSPKYWSDLWSPLYGRSELASDYYDEILFNGATFADLLKFPNRPLAVINATNLTSGERIGFTQDEFDVFCSDLGSVRLSRAAAASSAVPVVLTPVTIKNYAGRCAWKPPSWMAEIANPNNNLRPAGRALLRYREQQNMQDAKSRPFIHLVDGGISDNIGLRGVIESFELIEASSEYRKEIDFDKLRAFVSITVNSRSSPATDWDRSPTPPGFILQLLQSSSVPIDHYSYETVELLKDLLARMNQDRSLRVAQLELIGNTNEEAEKQIPKLNFLPIDVSFEAIEDPVERAYFMDMPTSLALTEEQVDRLRDLGGRLLRESKIYQELLRLVAKISAENP